MRPAGPSPMRQQSLHLQNSGVQKGIESEDGWLFESPSDLLCPITHELFKDPVINSAGQVYERVAIEHHLSTKGTDPITNAPLPNLQLIPVYTLKSRSFEFREHVAKACVDKACSTRQCEVSARYLRRAAELVSGLGGALKVPGLCDEVVDFLNTHPSNVYDAMALRIFADGLRASGYMDQASQLYLRLVEYGEDRAQQAAALQQCLICMSQDSSVQAQPPDKGLLPFLVHFLETQQTFGAAEVLELLHEAAVPDLLVLQLCEQMLARQAQHGGLGSPQLSSSGGPLAPQPSGPGGLQFNDLMLHYTRLRFSILQRQIDLLRPQAVKPGSSPSKRVSNSGRPAGLAAGRQGGQEAGAGQLGSSALAEGQQGPGQQQHEQPPWKRVMRFFGRRRKAVVSGMFVVASLLDTQQLVVRALQAGSAVLMVYCHTHTPHASPSPPDGQGAEPGPKDGLCGSV